LKQNYEEILSKLTILYVDDEKSSREAIRHLLDESVKDVYLADNGENGLKSYIKNRPDIIITDIKMPFVNGIDMAKEIKKIDQNAKIIFVNEYDDIDILMDTIEVGIEYFIKKPISKNHIDKAIEKVVDNIVYNKKQAEKSIQPKYILESLDNLVVLMSNKEIIDCNRSMLDFCGYATLEQLNDNIDSISELFIKRDGYIYADDTNSWIDKCFDTSSKHEVLMYDNKQKQNRVFLIEVTQYLIQSKELKYVVTLTDVTNIERLNTQNRDNLTDTYDREFITNQLENYMSYYQNTNKHFSIIMFRVNNLEEYNIKHGESSGDKMILDMVSSIKNVLNRHFMIGRLTGAKFLVLAPLVDSKRVEHIVLNIKTKLALYDNLEYSISYKEYDKIESRQSLLTKLLESL
jgi:diguanylate cyclase (GGDEF)-like protein